MNNRVGYVFRGRFKSELITDTRHLVYCLAYIQNNPLKAKLVKRAEDYAYSSYENYISGRGIVDFENAKMYYDISVENIAQIMLERTESKWIEHEEEREDTKKVLEQLKKRYCLEHEEKIEDLDLAVKITLQMQRRCGATIKEMARLLGKVRETLRKRVVEKTNP